MMVSDPEQNSQDCVSLGSGREMVEEQVDAAEGKERPRTSLIKNGKIYTWKSNGTDFPKGIESVGLVFSFVTPPFQGILFLCVGGGL